MTNGVLMLTTWPRLDVQLVARKLRFLSAQREMVQLETQYLHRLNWPAQMWSQNTPQLKKKKSGMFKWPNLVWPCKDPGSFPVSYLHRLSRQHWAQSPCHIHSGTLPGRSGTGHCHTGWGSPSTHQDLQPERHTSYSSSVRSFPVPQAFHFLSLSTSWV